MLSPEQLRLVPPVLLTMLGVFIASILVILRMPWYRALPEEVRQHVIWKSPSWFKKWAPIGTGVLLAFNVLVQFELISQTTASVVLSLLIAPFVLMAPAIFFIAIRSHFRLLRTTTSPSVKAFSLLSLAAYAYMTLLLGGIAVLAAVI